MGKKMIAFLMVLVVCFSIGVTPMAEAMTVFDPSNYSANSNNLLQSIQAVAYQYQQVQYSFKNLLSLDSATAALNLGQIQSQLSQLKSLQSTLTGLVSDYNNLQNQWKSVYGEVDFTTVSSDGYAMTVDNINTLNNNTLSDSAKIQSMVESLLSTNTTQLESLMTASQNSSGALAAAQAGNQIAAFNAQQVMLLQQMMANYNKAQLNYMKQKADEEQKYQKASQHFFGITE